MAHVKMRGDGRMAKNPKQTISRLLSYMARYKGTLAVVGVSVVFSAVAQAASSASLGALVDDYITPMLSQAVPDFAPLLRFLGMMACVYFVGLVSAFFCNYLMAKVSQGTQRSIRDQLFTHMQTLPIRYFDTHPAGDIMSRYTSDIDTLRQMISQAIPQCASSVVTLVVVLITMIITSPILTVLQLITVLAVVFVTKLIAGKSAKFFIGQQRSLGAVNG